MLSSIFDNDTNNDRPELYFKFVNDIASFSYDEIKLFDNFTQYDWLPRDNFRDLAYKVNIRLLKTVSVRVIFIILTPKENKKMPPSIGG